MLKPVLQSGGSKPTENIIRIFLSITFKVSSNHSIFLGFFAPRIPEGHCAVEGGSVRRMIDGIRAEITNALELVGDVWIGVAQ